MAAMTKKLCVAMLFCLVLFSDLAFSQESPVPPPESGSDSPTQSPTRSQSPSSSPSPALSPDSSASPPAPPLAPGSSTTPPTPSSSTPSPSPSPSPVPSPSDASDVNHSGIDDESPKSEKSSGMSAGKKAGIALGVVVGAGLVGLGGFVYKKRQENIRRTQQYGLEMRGSFI